MNETFISFYLRANRLHVFVDALRGIGAPKNICFLIEENGETLVLAPYPKKDFHSHRVPAAVYEGQKGMEVSSIKLCRLLAELYHWDLDCSYRVPGYIIPKQKIVVFYLKKAEAIEHDDVYYFCNPSK